jgi:hypothetical protein
MAQLIVPNVARLTIVSLVLLLSLDRSSGVGAEPPATGRGGLDLPVEWEPRLDRAAGDLGTLGQAFNQMTEELLLKEQYRGVLDKVVVADPIRDYAVRLVLSTHPGTDFATENVRRFVRWGASPRAAQSLIRAARVRALAEGRAHVAYEDIRHFANEVLQHRVLLNYDGQAENVAVPDLIRECLGQLTLEG